MKEVANYETALKQLADDETPLKEVADDETPLKDVVRSEVPSEESNGDETPLKEFGYDEGLASDHHPQGPLSTDTRFNAAESTRTTQHTSSPSVPPDSSEQQYDLKLREDIPEAGGVNQIPSLINIREPTTTNGNPPEPASMAPTSSIDLGGGQGPFHAFLSAEFCQRICSPTPERSS